MPNRPIGVDEVPPPDGFIVRECVYVKANYTAAGTADPAVGDYVTFNGTSNNEVAVLPDNQVKLIGRVKRVSTLDLTVTVEWLDVYAFAKLPTDDLSSVTLGDSVIKDGDTTAPAIFDAGSTTGNFIAVSKSGTSGAGSVVAAIVIG